MARKRTVDELSIDELRQVLMERQREARQERLRRYRKTGRLMRVEPPRRPATLDEMRSEALPDEAQVARREKPKTALRRWMDRLLLLVELAAVAGLVLLVFNGASLLSSLNQEVAASLEQPTLTPTAVFMAVVLPSGHTPPNAPGGAQPNDAEIPEHLRPLVQSIPDLPVPTSSPMQAVRIQIPSIQVDAPVVQGDGWEQLKKGVGQHLGTPNPGQNGNIVLSAHNDVFGEIFRYLDQLKEGDEIVLFTSERTFTYAIQQTQIVEPTRVEVLAQTSEPIVTLISCYPYLVDNQRIVVVASLQE
jgi:sortase A